MLLRGNCEQRKRLSGSETSPCLAHSLPELDPKLNLSIDQLFQWDAQDFKENYNVHLWAQVQRFLKSWEKMKLLLPPVFSIQHILHTPSLFSEKLKAAET